ncbi:MAG: DsbA family oxidoreductase [Alphaproteobacteria bacterium]|nr:DsbA family oxidoreductase [Alphaproteobacteria bacterium]
MRIDIISDTICPWCYVGKRRFERALAELPAGTEVTVAWWPFQLNPQMPPEGKERAGYLVERFGSEERAREIFRPLEAAGRSEGIPFAFNEILRTPNTMASHRLIAFAGERGRQNEVVEVLFRRYFELGEDIGELGVLVASAVEAGLDEDETRAYLESDQGRSEVEAGDVAARKLGINGVPCFIVNARYALSGAQEPEVFRRVFDLAANEVETATSEQS